MKYGKYIDFFAEKMQGKSYSHFCSKYIWNTLATTVNMFVINKLIKLTRLWTTGPWGFSFLYIFLDK